MNSSMLRVRNPQYSSQISALVYWWSFSWKENNLAEIFKWYDDHTGKIVFSENTKQKVEKILSQMKELIVSDENEQSKID